MDYSNLSDEELDKLLEEKLSKKDKPDYSKMSDADLDAEIAKKTAGGDSIQGPLETFAETAADEATLGYYPQIAAGIKTLGGFNGDYAAQRDIERRELQKGQYENPVSSGAGTVAAIAAQMAIPAGGALRLSKLAKSGAPIAKQAIVEGLKNFGLGSVISGLKNPGDVEGEVDILQPEHRIENIVSEAPLNVLSSATGGLIDAKAAKSAAGASKSVVKALRPTPTKTSVLIQNDAKRAKEVGEFIFSKKIVTPGDTAEQIYSKADSEVKKAGSLLNNFIKKSSKSLDSQKELSDIKLNPTFGAYKDLPDLYAGLQTFLVKNGYSNAGESTDKVIEQVLNDLKSLREITKRSPGTSRSEVLSLNLDGLNQMKRFMQDQVASYDNIADSTKDAGVMSEAYNYAANYFSKKVDEEISRFGDDEMGKALKHLNKQYSLASDARGLALRNAVKDFNKSSSNIPAISGIGSSGMTYALTKDPMVSSMVGLSTGITANALQNVSPTTVAAMKNQAPSFLKRNIIPKASAYYSAYESTPVIEAEKMLDQALMQGIPPFVIEKELTKSDLKNTEKAKLRIKNAKATK